MNRLKILAAFENLPNIIEMAQDKAKTMPLDVNNPKSIKLHGKIGKLHKTLLQTLPFLMHKLVPNTFGKTSEQDRIRGIGQLTLVLIVKTLKSPFGSWKIDELLGLVETDAESVKVCAEGMIDELIVGNYSASVNILSQLEELGRQQRIMQMSIESNHSKTELVGFLMEQLSTPNPIPDLWIHSPFS